MRPTTNRRPAPEVVKARLAEIKKRYRRRRRHASAAQFAAIRLSELNRLFKARHGDCLPHDDTGRELVSIAAHHMIRLAGHPQQRLMNWASLRAPWLSIEEVNGILAETATSPKTWKADTLAWRLRLTYAERQVLKIASIGAIDCNAQQRAARRRARSKARSKAYRTAKKRPANTP